MSCRTSVAMAFLALASGCDTCPPDYHIITSMRVLGTTYDPPVASPGGVVTVTAHTADVDDRDVSVSWYRCPANLTLTSIASPDGELDASSAVSACLTRGPFATGRSVRVPIDSAGGGLDASPYRTRRRWTDLVGVACAGGDLEAPPKGGLWPRCTGSRSVVFTASIPGPTPDGDTAAPQPASLVDFTLGGSAWSASSTPTVARCEDSRATCAPVTVGFTLVDAVLATELTGLSTGILGAADDGFVFLNYHVTGAAPANTEYCEVPDTAATLRLSGPIAELAWVPPSSSGEVTFWFTARRYSGGLTITRRTVRVE